MSRRRRYQDRRFDRFLTGEETLRLGQALRAASDRGENGYAIAAIGEEVHEDRDQFFRIETGEGEVWIDGVSNKVKADDGIVVPAGAKHNVVNSGSEPLKLYTLYGPPEHADGTVHVAKADADAAHEHFDGRTTE